VPLSVVLALRHSAQPEVRVAFGILVEGVKRVATAETAETAEAWQQFSFWIFG
jgi:hypothetical protein